MELVEECSTWEDFHSIFYIKICINLHPKNKHDIPREYEIGNAPRDMLISNSHPFLVCVCVCTCALGYETICLFYCGDIQQISNFINLGKEKITNDRYVDAF